LSSTPEKGKEPLVYVASAPNDIIANLWKGILEDNGIHPFLKSINLMTSIYVSPANLQREIYVLASEAEKAREVLAPFLEEE